MKTEKLGVINIECKEDLTIFDKHLTIHLMTTEKKKMVRASGLAQVASGLRKQRRCLISTVVSRLWL